jgi:Photosynthesis system II assembly factor YCF48
MPNVPKFVLKRLRETLPVLADSHPDADLLTAFAEQSLADRERGLVMEHLAVCGDCRDVVALALPATEIIDHAVPAGDTTRTGWFGWPSLRWGALAAGVVAVISVGVLQYTHRLQENRVASNVTLKDAAPEAAVSNQQALPQATAPRTEMRSKGLAAPVSQTLAANEGASEAKRVVQPPSPAGHANTFASSAGAGIGSGAGRGISGKVLRSPSASGQTVSSSRGGDLALAPPSAAPTVPAPNTTAQASQEVQVSGAQETVEVSGATGPVATESASTLPQNQIAQNQADLPLNGRNVTNLDVVKAKDADASAVHGSAGKQSVASPSMPLQTSPALMVRASPRWSISSAGALQRSFDGGNTWENVDPNLSSSFLMSESVTVNGAAPTKTDKKAEYRSAGSQDKKDQKAEAAQNLNPVFRAVAASGLEVWAGGSAGMLFHTTDGGGIWIRVTPSSGGAILAGDIVNIQFSDKQHGRVTTSTPELWTTSDAGRTWEKQAVARPVR